MSEGMTSAAPSTISGRFLRIVAFVLALLSLGAWGVSAQGSPGDEIRPASFWWEASLGGGALQVSCRICSGDIDSGPLLNLGAGAYASRTLALGVELGGWTVQDGDVRERILRGGVTARYAPDPSGGLHFLAGAGWMFWSADDFGYSAPQLLLGLGWSIPLGTRWSVGPRLTFDVAPRGTLRNGDVAVAEGTRMGLARFTVFVRSR